MKTKIQEPILVGTNGHQGPFSLIPNLAEGHPLPFEEMLSSFLVTGTDTEGKLTLVEAIQRKGYEPPSRIYPENDVTFYVGEGEITFYVEGATIAAPAGTNVFIGRGKEHSFKVKTQTAHTLIIFTPAVSQSLF
jgi:quercetin dioxygenase-like cupin family protein